MRQVLLFSIGSCLHIKILRHHPLAHTNFTHFCSDSHICAHCTYLAILPGSQSISTAHLGELFRPVSSPQFWPQSCSTNMHWCTHHEAPTPAPRAWWPALQKEGISVTHRHMDTSFSSENVPHFSCTHLKCGKA